MSVVGNVLVLLDWIVSLRVAVVVGGGRGPFAAAVARLVEGVEHVEEDCRLHDAQIVENFRVAFLVVAEEATVDAEDDKLRQLQLRKVLFPPKVTMQAQHGHRIVQVHYCEKGERERHDRN